MISSGPATSCDFKVPRMARRPFLVLASQSPRRVQLLRQAGLLLRVCAPRIREVEGLTGTGSRRRTPCMLVRCNARRKALVVARRFPRRWVLGADTVVVLGRHIWGKPADRNEAAHMLRRLSGRTHRVLTAICLCRGKRVHVLATTVTHVTFRCLGRREIQAYLRRVNPLDKAGAYAFQQHGGRIIRRIRGSWSNVVGLPMECLRRHLQGLGAASNWL